jgi:hypothetical protein
MSGVLLCFSVNFPLFDICILLCERIKEYLLLLFGMCLCEEHVSDYSDHKCQILSTHILCFCFLTGNANTIQELPPGNADLCKCFHDKSNN